MHRVTSCVPCFDLAPEFVDQEVGVFPLEVVPRTPFLPASCLTKLVADILDNEPSSDLVDLVVQET